MKKVTEALLSHIIVIPAKAGISWRSPLSNFKNLRDTRFRGYDVYFLFRFSCPLTAAVHGIAAIAALNVTATLVCGTAMGGVPFSVVIVFVQVLPGQRLLL